MDIIVPLSQQACDSTATMNVDRICSDTSCSTFSPWKYDVFLSFRGEDTRKNFVDHLYAALNQKGILVFRDDKELERGKAISPELLKAIEESRFSIVVFSKNYASSTWCLDELVKIVECMNTLGQRVYPIFYDVDPSVVRKQIGPFQKAFAKHAKVFKEKMEKVQNWRSALIEVANLSGWDAKDRHESVFIQDIVKEISKKLNPTTFVKIKDLVGINSRLEKLKKLIGIGSTDVRMIGICGMGGIGKTTIARVVYDLISCKFEGGCFLANVREISEKDGMISLQKQLLSQILLGIDINIWDVDGGIKEIRKRLQHKNVLIVIDDVVHIDQLNKLAGKHDWFGVGSRIIITTRDKYLLVAHRVDEVYDAEELSDDEAFKLFSLKAFDHGCEPPKDFVELIKQVVKYTGGLPLALEVLGSFFLGRVKDEWESAIERLKRDPEKGILDKLQLSFDGLKETEKKIFLDIACFFKGKDRNYVTRILDGCGFYPTIGISVLVGKSLISISNGYILWMHDLLQDMGRQIVKRESLARPGERSRLWEEKDIRHVLTRNTGTEIVEGIMVDSLEEEVCCSPEAFSKMINLRLLKIRNVQLPKGLENLSNELRLLDWVGYPLKYLPTNLKLDKVVELKLNDSLIKELLKGTQVFNILKPINFEGCQYLYKTPDFTRAPNLERVILKRCIRLHEIHPSLLLHKKITCLNLTGCTSLKTLPNKIHMESLEHLCLCLCSKLKYFPEIMGRMEHLFNVDLCGTAIKDLPLSIEFLTGLESLELDGCKNLESLPVVVNGLKSLENLSLSGCFRLENLPDNLWQVENLKTLDVSGTAIRQMSSIFCMKKLRKLDFHGCKGPSNSLSSFFSMASSMSIRSSDSMIFRLPYLSVLCASLRILSLSNCNLDEEAIPNDFFGSFSSLRELDLSYNNFVSLPRSINHLSKLEYLNVNGCTSLKTLSNALRLCSSELTYISCVNCLKLMGCNNMAFSMLKEHINKVQSVLKLGDKFGFFKWPRRFEDENFGIFGMVVPGSEIPKWFSNEGDGSIINIKRPPYLYNNSKLVGYVVCSVFAIRGNLRSFEVLYYAESNGELLDSPSGVARFHINFAEQFGQAVSDHLVLVYFPREFSECTDAKYNGLEFLFCDPSKVEMKRCGVHPVYEEDVKEFNKINSRSTCWNWNAFQQDDVVGSAKRKSCYDEGPQPKRFKVFNLFNFF